MSVESKIYKWEGTDWVLKSTTSGLSYDTGFSLFDSGRVIFWRVDTYDTETELTTVGDVWVFWLAPQIFITGDSSSITGYDLVVAGQVVGYSPAVPWIPDGYIIILPGEIADYPELDLPNDQIDFDLDLTVATLETYSNVEWQFIDGSWQWSDLQNFVGGGRYQNIVAAFSHNKILIESF
jgi:hypothetical protein